MRSNKHHFLPSTNAIRCFKEEIRTNDVIKFFLRLLVLKLNSIWIKNLIGFCLLNQILVESLVVT